MKVLTFSDLTMGYGGYGKQGDKGKEQYDDMGAKGKGADKGKAKGKGDDKGKGKTKGKPTVKAEDMIA